MVLKRINFRNIILTASIQLLLTSICMAGILSLPHKKVQKEAERLFLSDLQFVEVPVSDNVTGLDELLHEGDLVHVIISGEGVLGYVISTYARGRYDNFDYSVIFSKDLSVLGLLVTTYRSSHGAAICSKGWLRQFKGYHGEEIALGKDIDSISGATISASSLVADIRRCYKIMEKLRVQEVFIQACPGFCHPYSASRSVSPV
jgi:Na+-translocating ferredoxin:NAD+ oxidoreductase RnfG subunit